MGLATKFILISVVLITLFVAGLILIARKLANNNILPVRMEQEEKSYQFWLAMMIPALGYWIVNLPIVFNTVSSFGGKLPVTSLFPFLVCEFFTPVLVAFLVNIFVPFTTSVSRAIIFSLPLFLVHLYHVAERWLYPLIQDLQAVQNPNRQITFSFVKMEMQIGIALFMEVIFISWLSATTIKRVAKSRLT